MESVTGNLFWPFIYRHASGGISYAVIPAKCLREALLRAGEIAGKGVTAMETMGVGEFSRQDARDKWPALRQWAEREWQAVAHG